MSWEESAACLDVSVHVFYSALPHLQAVALATCRSCQVKEACLAASLLRPEAHGIWGEMLPRDRMNLRRRRRYWDQKYSSEYLPSSSASVAA